MITEGRYRANRAFLAVSAHLSPLRLLLWVPYTYSASGICLKTSHRHIIADMPPAKSTQFVHSVVCSGWGGF